MRAEKDQHLLIILRQTISKQNHDNDSYLCLLSNAYEKDCLFFALFVHWFGAVYAASAASCQCILMELYDGSSFVTGHDPLEAFPLDGVVTQAAVGFLHFAVLPGSALHLLNITLLDNMVVYVLFVSILPRTASDLNLSLLDHVVTCFLFLAILFNAVNDLHMSFLDDVVVHILVAILDWLSFSLGQQNGNKTGSKNRLHCQSAPPKEQRRNPLP